MSSQAREAKLGGGCNPDPIAFVYILLQVQGNDVPNNFLYVGVLDIELIIILSIRIPPNPNPLIYFKKMSTLKTLEKKYQKALS